MFDDDGVMLPTFFSFASDVSKLLDRDDSDVFFRVYFAVSGEQACVDILASNQLFCFLGGRKCS